jgi:hypothetical protein
VTLAANFFKISLNFDVAFGMERTRRDVTQVQGMQQLTDCPLMVSNLVFRFDPPLNIHTAPTDKTIFLWIRGLQCMCLHGRLLLSRQPLLWMTARRIAQTFRSLRVETVHPVTQGLAVHPAAGRRILPARPFQNCRYRRQAQSNPPIILPTREFAQITRAKILPDCYRSMHAPLQTMKPLPNHKSAKKEIANRISSLGLW